MRSLPAAPAMGLASILPDQPVGSLALAAAVAASAQPANPASEAAGEASTFAGYAALEFTPSFRASDMDVLRTIYEQNWTPLAVAMSMLMKDHSEMTAFASGTPEKSNLATAADVLEMIDAAATWFGETANIMRGASTRLLAGICRSFKDSGGSLDDDGAPKLDRPLPPKHADEALLDLNLRWIDIEEEWQRPGDEPETVVNERSERQSALLDAIVAQPAAGLAGLKVKARVLAGEADLHSPSIADDAAVMAWAAEGLKNGTYLDRIIASLVLDVFRLADAQPSTAPEAA